MTTKHDTAREYPPLPEDVAFLAEYGGDVFTADQMRAYVDADRAARAQPAGAATPAAPDQPWQDGDCEVSPTAGLNIAQRILHVGGRNNAAGYVEFGSIQAVEALVHQVLRDLPLGKAAAQMALEALEKAESVFDANDTHPIAKAQNSAAITALREALAAPAETARKEIDPDSRTISYQPAESAPSLANDPRLCCRSHPHERQNLSCQLREVGAWLRWCAATGKQPAADAMNRHAEKVDAVALAMAASQTLTNEQTGEKT